MVGCLSGSKLHVNNSINTQLLYLLKATALQVLSHLFTTRNITLLLCVNTEHILTDTELEALGLCPLIIRMTETFQGHKLCLPAHSPLFNSVLVSTGALWHTS